MTPEVPGSALLLGEVFSSTPGAVDALSHGAERHAFLVLDPRAHQLLRLSVAPSGES